MTILTVWINVVLDFLSYVIRLRFKKDQLFSPPIDSWFQSFYELLRTWNNRITTILLFYFAYPAVWGNSKAVRWFWCRGRCSGPEQGYERARNRRGIHHQDPRQTSLLAEIGDRRDLQNTIWRGICNIIISPQSCKTYSKIIYIIPHLHPRCWQKAQIRLRTIWYPRK